MIEFLHVAFPFQNKMIFSGRSEKHCIRKYSRSRWGLNVPFLRTFTDGLNFIAFQFLHGIFYFASVMDLVASAMAVPTHGQL